MCACVSTLDGRDYAVTVLAVGNPHCVVVVPDLAAVPIDVLGPAIERNPAFPQRANVQFATPIDRGHVRAIVCEHGAGVTLASGSSACAVAAVLIGMPGGDLRVRRDEHDHLWLTGAVEEICQAPSVPTSLGTLAASLKTGRRYRILMGDNAVAGTKLHRRFRGRGQR